MPVDVVGELDETKGLPEAVLHGPREIRRVDGKTVAADAGARRELHEPEGLRGRCIDHFPDVDVEIMGEHGEFVHQRDVHVPKGVLEEFGQLGFTGAFHRDGLVDALVVEPLHRRQRGRADTSDDLRCVDEVPDRIPRIDSLGRVAQEVVVIGAQPCGVLDPRRHELFGRPGVGRRFENDGRTCPEVRAQQVDGRLDEPQIRSIVRERRRNGNDREIEAGEVIARRGREVDAVFQGTGELGVADVLDVRRSLSKASDLGFVDVESDDREPDLGRPDRHR